MEPGEIFAEISDLLGKKQDAAYYRRLMEKSIRSCRKIFTDGTVNIDDLTGNKSDEEPGGGMISFNHCAMGAELLLEKVLLKHRMGRSYRVGA